MEKCAIVSIVLLRLSVVEICRLATVLVLLYAYRTVTIVLRLVDFVQAILLIEYIRTKVSNELGVIRTIQSVCVPYRVWRPDCLCPTVSKTCTIG